MADTYITVGSTGHKKKLVDLGDSLYGDAVALAPAAVQTELTLAAATGSTDGLGKIATIPASGTIYVRCEAGQDVGSVAWQVKADKTHAIQLYRARTKVNGATITLAAATRVDDTDTFTLNGLTYTAESTAGDAAWASRKWKSGGTDEEADAAQLAALINADYAVLVDGSVTVGDKVTIVTDEGTFVLTAAAAADYPNSVWDQSGNQAAELASLVLAINHRDTITVGQDTTTLAATAPATNSGEDYALVNEQVLDHNTHTALTTVHKASTAAIAPASASSEATLIAAANAVRTALIAHYADTTVHNAADTTNGATVAATTAATNAATARTLINALVAPMAAHIALAKVQAGDTFTVNGLTFTGHATVTTAATRQFKVDEATASDTADELVTLLDDATYGVEDTTSVNASGAIGITRDTADVTVTITAAPAATSVHSCITIAEAGGVPGVIAVATGATGELGITPVWTEVLTVTDTALAGGATTHITTTDIDNPGILATVAAAVITLSCATPGGTDEEATVIQFGQGSSDANEIAFADTTLASLVKQGNGWSAIAANSTTAGALYAQDVEGWPYCYLGLTNSSVDAMTPVVKAHPSSAASADVIPKQVQVTGMVADVDLDLEAADLGVAAEGAALGVGVLIQGDDGTDRTNVLVDTAGHLQVDAVTCATHAVTVASGGIASGAVASGAVASGAVVDGAVVTLGAKADDKSTATDTTAVSLMSVAKQISASAQGLAAAAATEGDALGEGILIQGDDGTDRTNVLVDTDGHLQVDVLSAASTAVTNVGTFAVQAVGAGASLAVKASAAETTSTNGTAVACGQYKRFAVLLDVTALATDVGDTLDVFIDMSPDGGTTWINAAHFDQVVGTGSAEKQWAVLDSAAPGTSVVDVTSDAAEEAVRPYVFGSHIRYRSTIVDAGDANVSFTYAVTAFAQ